AVANYYTVTYSANEGVLTSDSTQDYTITGTISFPTAPTRTGYTFAGWFTAATAGTVVEAGAAASTTTLYAQWTVQQTRFFIIWKSDGADQQYNFVNTGEALPSAPALTKEGFTLTWDLAPDYRDMTITAIWTPIVPQ
ncbi:MAG: InlB B-repeat-containing protein, partial [Chloroflexi bacterium]|nr:InlB B-repeat-containing protein [Chloroflexota bacterium]